MSPDIQGMIEFWSMLDNKGVILDKVAGPNLFFKLQFVFYQDQRCCCCCCCFFVSQSHALTVHLFNPKSDQNEMSPCNISAL